MFKTAEKKMPQKWCKYWLPFQWILLTMKGCYFVENKKMHYNFKKLESDYETKRTKHHFEASLFQDKHAYLHVIKEVYYYYNIEVRKQ